MKCKKRFSNLIGAGEGNRTLVLDSASQRTTTMLHLQIIVLPEGLEPPTLWSVAKYSIH